MLNMKLIKIKLPQFADVRMVICVFWVLGATLSACTAQTTKKVKTPAPAKTDASQEKPKTETNTSPCPTFQDSRMGDDALESHVIYRDFIRRGSFEEALPYWRHAIKWAPAADGKRTTHFDDGVAIYTHLLNKQESEAAKRLYLDSVLYMYDRMKECFPDYAYADGKKAFDLYYNFRELVDDKTIFTHFTDVLDAEGLKTPAFVINPFTALLVDMFLAKKVDQPTAVKYAKLVLDITDSHTEDMKEGWPIVLGYAPIQLEAFETVKGFYDCDYFVDKYFKTINPDSVSCDDIPLIRAHLRWGDCPEANAAFAVLQEQYFNRCITSTPSSGPLSCGRDALNDGRYQDAINCYKEYVESTDDPERKGRYNLRIAKIYYGHLKNFAKAREHARLALRELPNLGEAYILIGKLYASSGPLCGPGRGWESQIVTWPAIDMFMKAKQVDSSVSFEATKLINDYSRYMPSIEEIFQRQLAEGQSFFVGCWIQENTTIRAAKNN
jgi:hypothetical protein